MRTTWSLLAVTGFVVSLASGTLVGISGADDEPRPKEERVTVKQLEDGRVIELREVEVRDSDRPRVIERREIERREDVRREGERPREGERRDVIRREGDRPRDAERTRDVDRPREVDRPRDGDRAREPARREGDRGEAQRDRARRAEAEAVEQKIRALREHGANEEAERLTRHLKELLAREPAVPPERGARVERAEQERREERVERAAHAERAERAEQRERAEREAHEARRHLEVVIREHAPTAAEHKLREVHAALDEAKRNGQHDLVEKLSHAARAIEREVAAAHQHGRAEGRGIAVGEGRHPGGNPEIRELSEQVQSLRREIAELRELVKHLAERR